MKLPQTRPTLKEVGSPSNISKIRWSILGSAFAFEHHFQPRLLNRKGLFPQPMECCCKWVFMPSENRRSVSVWIRTLSCLILSLRVVLINSQRALDVQGRQWSEIFCKWRCHGHFDRQIQADLILGLGCYQGIYVSNAEAQMVQEMLCSCPIAGQYGRSTVHARATTRRGASMCFYRSTGV